jgi:hypothetical protein
MLYPSKSCLGPAFLPRGCWEHLNAHLFGRRICRAGADDVCWWPQRFPEIIPFNFFMWGSIKGKTFVRLCRNLYQSWGNELWLPQLRHWGLSAHSLGRVTVSSRHLPYYSRNKYRICDVCKKLREFLCRLMYVWIHKYAAFGFCIILKV